MNLNGAGPGQLKWPDWDARDVPRRVPILDIPLPRRMNDNVVCDNLNFLGGFLPNEVGEYRAYQGCHSTVDIVRRRRRGYQSLSLSE